MYYMNSYIKLILQKSLIKIPKHKMPIPSVWKCIWKKELFSVGVTNCRHVGCTYTCTSIEDICNHFKNCNFIPEKV